MLRLKILLLYISFNFCSFAKNLPPLPNPPKLVNDFSGILLPQETQQLENKLQIYNDSSSTQITIVIENSLEDDDLFDYSFRLAQEWGIGQKGKNNGVLIYISTQDRKIRIQVGYGLEATLTDANCKQIIEELIKPAFKQKQYYLGINQATSRIIAITKGEYKSDTKEKKNNASKLILTILIVIIALVVLSISNKGGGGGKTYSSSGSDWWTAAMIGSAMSGSRHRSGSSWGDFSSGSGSFGGFGGGSFGGGGSSGDW